MDGKDVEEAAAAEGLYYHYYTGSGANWRKRSRIRGIDNSTNLRWEGGSKRATGMVPACPYMSRERDGMMCLIRCGHQRRPLDTVVAWAERRILLQIQWCCAEPRRRRKEKPLMNDGLGSERTYTWISFICSREELWLDWDWLIDQTIYVYKVYWTWAPSLVTGHKAPDPSIVVCVFVWRERSWSASHH